VRKLAQELGRRGRRVSHRLVAELLHELGYSLQTNAKTLEGSSHPDRNAQFEHIQRKVRRFLRQRQPVISVDTKKKELVGDFKNGESEWEAMRPVVCRTLGLSAQSQPVLDALREDDIR